MRRFSSLASQVCLVVLGVLFVKDATTAVQRQLTEPKKNDLLFAQITDIHMFDDGWQAKGSDPYTFAMDDRTALHWAIDAINERASSTPVDFVVFTGDFGVQNIFFADPKCSVTPFKSEPGLPPFSFEIAAQELAIELNRLQVPDFYVVAGNNDIISEKVEDYPRFLCFISQLRSELQKLGGRIHVETLRPDTAMTAGRFRLAGLNSSSFKDSVNFAQACASSAPRFATADLSCPASQIQSLQGMLKSGSSAPLLLFTHVPDLRDPYKTVPGNPSVKLPSWSLDPKTQSEWLNLAASPQVVGLFAGHFHSNRREIYATDSVPAELVIDATDAGKTWVAPPLAGKNQRDGSGQARGLMWVKVDSNGGHATVDATAQWYSGAGPASNSAAGSNESHGAPQMCQLNFFGLTVFVILAAGFFGGYLNFLLNQGPKGEPSFSANVVLGIGASFLTPLFLHAIGSDLMDQMHYGQNGQPQYSKVLVFAGFCLVASMSARAFINSVSGRVLRQAAEDVRQAAEDAQEDVIEGKRLLQDIRRELDYLKAERDAAQGPRDNQKSTGQD